MEKVKAIFEKMNIALDDAQTQKLVRFYELLVEKNKVMNLTAITEYDEVLVKHFADSALIANAFDIKKDNLKIIDVGTGAGFPGMVLKIVFPNLKITLLDSLNKRVNFLNEVIEELELKDIDAVHGRAEDFGTNPTYRESYDLCVSRAVANLSSLSEYCLPFVKIGGAFISYKAEDCEEEVANAKKAITVLGGDRPDVKKMGLPNSDIFRKFVIIRKIKPTGKKYPRKAGLPTKEPIK